MSTYQPDSVRTFQRLAERRGRIARRFAALERRLNRAMGVAVRRFRKLVAEAMRARP